MADDPCCVCRPRGVSFFHAGAAVNRRWTLILEALTEKGVLRFTRLSELVEGVSQKMLTQTVRHMEHDGLITNYDVTAGHSPR